MDDESAESMEPMEEVPLIELGELIELGCCYYLFLQKYIRHKTADTT